MIEFFKILQLIDLIIPIPSNFTSSLFVPSKYTFKRAWWFSQYLEATTSELRPHNTLCLMDWPVSLFLNPLSEIRTLFGHSPPCAKRGRLLSLSPQQVHYGNNPVICIFTMAPLANLFNGHLPFKSLLWHAPPNLSIYDVRNFSFFRFKHWSILIMYRINFQSTATSSWRHIGTR